MQDQSQESVGTDRSTSEDFRDVPNDAEGFRNVPKNAETFRKVPNASVAFGNMRKGKERTENHTVTVRDAARCFEASGVPRTERSIINWCQPNRQGVARLDAFFDENEGRYYITPQSVSRAIEEEKAKQSVTASAAAIDTEVPHRSETSSRTHTNDGEVEELERKNRDLEILTRAKDFYIEQLKKERGDFVERMIGMSRYVGELETQVLQLGGARGENHTLPQNWEPFRNESGESR